MHVRSRFLMVLPLLALAACGDETRQSTGPSVPGIAPQVSDGRNGGNPYFYFLPPDISTTTLPQSFSTAWAPNLDVTFCPTSAPGASCSGAEVGLPPVQLVGVAPTQFYQTSWNPPTSQPLGDYRITVYAKIPVGGDPDNIVRTALGWADLVIVPTGTGNGPADTYQITLGSSNQPINFFIARGLATGGNSDAEVVVGNNGQVVTCVSDQCGFYFPPGWLDGKGFSEVSFFVERFPQLNGECVTDGLISALTPQFAQYEGCFKAFTVPDMGAPSQPITFGMCSELASTNPLYHALSPFKYDPATGTDPQTIRELPNAAPLGPGGLPLYSITQCPVLTGLGPTGPQNMLWGGARQFASRVAGFFAPREAWAVDLGLGGQLGISFDAFSDFFWGVPFRVDINSGNNQTAEVGAALLNPIAVKVTGTHVHVHDVDLTTLDQQGLVGIAGIPVTFTVTTGGGLLGVGGTTSVIVNTDANGIASTTWTLGLTEGANTVTATVPDDPGQFNRRKSVTFSATGTPFSNKSTQIRVQSPVIKDQPVSSVTLKLGDETPFNAKLYQSGQSSTTACTWSPLGTSTYLNIYVPGSDPGAVKITGIALTPTTRNYKGEKVTITCGTQKLDIFLFVI